MPTAKESGAGTTEIKTRAGLLISTDTAKTDEEWMDWKDTRKKTTKSDKPVQRKQQLKQTSPLK
jgi:hypothetical protein